jgi:exosortase/archaeosortase family protein
VLPLALLGLAHAALAVRTGCSPYYVAAIIAWTGAVLSYGDRAAPSAKASLTSQIAGAALCAAGLVGAAYWSRDYYAALRFTALFAGGGFLIFRNGARSLRARELILLSLPMLTPVPQAIVAIFAPQKLTLLFTAALLRLAGEQPAISGDVLSISNGAIRVIDACCGFAGTSQLIAVAMLLGCLFETTRAQKIGIFAAALAAGFVANCSRLATLAILTRTDYAAFEWWHSSAGEHRFTIAALALSGLAWWLMMRERKENLREVAAR